MDEKIDRWMDKCMNTWTNGQTLGYVPQHVADGGQSPPPSLEDQPMRESAGAMCESQPEVLLRIVQYRYLYIQNLCVPAEEKPMVRIVKESTSVRSLKNSLSGESR